MRLRARLALVALVLILVPIIVMSLISLDSRIDTMIEDMSRSTDFMIEQIFEQARHLLMVIVTTAGLVIAGALLVVTLISNRIMEQLAVLTRGYEQLAAGANP